MSGHAMARGRQRVKAPAGRGLALGRALRGLLPLAMAAAVPGALGAAVAAPQPAAPPPASAAECWQALREGRLPAAEAGFTALLARSPGNPEILAGLGYTALRNGDLSAAAGWFAQALAASPGDRDATVGLALVEEARGELPAALARLEAVTARWPEDLEAAGLRRRVAAAAGRPVPLGGERHLDPAPRPGALQLPMRVSGRNFELPLADGTWRAHFLKAVNLGAALPGRFPAEFPDDIGTYREWLRGMKDAGFEAVRVYTILPPPFYDALGELNAARPDDPLWLVHGVWAELPERHDFSAPGYTTEFQADLRRVVDLVHGALDLPPRPGHAGGRYRTDVSRWWIATIIGREWEPFAIADHDALHPGLHAFAGRFVTGDDLTASERWLAEQLDHVVGYETERWNAQRPTAFSNWPTLDPLRHPTESSFDEEEVWRRKLGFPARRAVSDPFDDDRVAVDMEKLAATPANRGGLFAAYHVYPYYPDFLIYDTRFRSRVGAADAAAPYTAYLTELAAHHRSHPLFIAEFGIPTSREHAHQHPTGWTHGGHSEVAQGEILVAMLQVLHRTGTAGGALFAWIDEWFKHTWRTRPMHRPEERNRLWHDARDPEQHYGLLAMRPGRSGQWVNIDGDDRDWRAIDPVLSSPEEDPMVRSLAAQADASDLLLVLHLEPGTTPALAVAVDTLGGEHGDRRFPAGLDLESEMGFEAALIFDGDSATVVVDEPYDPWTHRFGDVLPRRNAAGVYVEPRAETNRLRIGSDGTVFPEVVLPYGRLHRAPRDGAEARAVPRAEWQHDVETGVLEVRIPWGLLNVTDPSSRAVLYRSSEEPQGWRATEGFRFAVAIFERAPGAEIRALGGRALETLPARRPDGRVPVSNLFTWDTWEQPEFHVVPKASLAMVREALPEIPDVPAEVDLP